MRKRANILSSTHRKEENSFNIGHSVNRKESLLSGKCTAINLVIATITRMKEFGEISKK